MAAMARMLCRFRNWGVLALVGGVIIAALAYATFRHPAPICLAVANSLSGPSGSVGQESLAAIELAVEEANNRGGVNGRRLKLVPFDDKGRAEIGRRNVPAIVDGPCVAVLGHYFSSVSLAAGPLYMAARIPALTGTAFADELTIGNPWYFRAQTTVSVQGRSIAEYLAVLDGAPPVELIHSDDSFGRSFLRGFSSSYLPGRFRTWRLASNPAIRPASARAIAEALSRLPSRNIIVVGTSAENIPDVVMAVRRLGIRQTIVTSAGAGSETFLQRFANQPEEKRRPGFFSNNLYSTPPLIFDSASAEAQALAVAYRQKTDRPPSWIAAGAYDSARMMIEALRRAQIRNRPDTVRQDRERVRAALAGMNSPRTGIQGLVRTLYFDAQHNIPSPVRLGGFGGGRFVTAPRQLVLVEHPEAIDLAEEVRAGHIARAGDRYYWLQQVVWAGIDFNRLDRIDVKEGSFNVDLNLWLRFVGDDAAPTRIAFPALLDRDAFDADKPVEFDPIAIPVMFNRPIGMGREDQMNYRLYRIAGNFKADYDLHDYPFDEQRLLIRFHNRVARSQLVTYVVDTAGLALAKSRQVMPENTSPFRGLQQWRVAEVRYFIDSLSTSSTFGKPTLFGNNVETTFAGFNAVIVLQRNYGIFVIKTMIPLLLLVLVVYATLFVPENLYRERITIPVTAILTSAVLLLSINAQLGDVGYTVAIEYIFYAFFLCCLGAMLVGIAHDALIIGGRPEQARLLARSGQILYVALALLFIVFFWWRYGVN